MSELVFALFRTETASVCDPAARLGTGITTTESAKGLVPAVPSVNDCNTDSLSAAAPFTFAFAVVSVAKLVYASVLSDLFTLATSTPSR